MLSILAFILGSSVGSFVQVVASRLHVAPIVNGRSKCLSCGEALRISDLIPIVSYLFLKGKCRYCKSTYGASSLIIELLYGCVFLLLYVLILSGYSSLFISFIWLVYYTIFFCILGVMALYDRIHSYIPISFLLSFLALSFLMFFLRLHNDLNVTSFLSPIFVALPFFLIWVASKGRAVGFGDVIIFFGVGAFFGSLQGLAVLMISVWMGAVYGLYIKYLVVKKTDDYTPIPFVPFIVLAFLIVLFTGIDFFSFFLV